MITKNSLASPLFRMRAIAPQKRKGLYKCRPKHPGGAFDSGAGIAGG